MAKELEIDFEAIDADGRFCIVTASALVEPRDEEVGIMSEYLTDVDVKAVDDNGKKVGVTLSMWNEAENRLNRKLENENYS